VPRQFVIADIHGCCRTFRHLVFDRIKLTREDSLVLLGDYIDRGPDSKGVLDTIIELQLTGYEVHPILGNHEQLLLQSTDPHKLAIWLDNGGIETLASYDVKHPFDLPDDHVEFMQNLPECHVSDTHVFVHAGLNFCLVDPLIMTSQDFKLWNRQKQKVTPATIGNRKLVTGHTVHYLDAIDKSLKSVHIRLDNGCYMGDQYSGKGNLVAFELTTGELTVQENIE